MAVGVAVSLEPSTAGSRRQPGNGPRIRPSLLIAAAITVMLGCTALGFSRGPAPVPPGEVLLILAKHGLDLPVGATVEPFHEFIVWRTGVPKILLAALAGAGLALSGVAAQALVRNALAEPFVLGVSSGATLGTVSAAALGIGFGTVLYSGGAAVLGALFALLLVLAFGRASGGASSLRLVLAGVAIGHMLAGVTGWIVVVKINAQASTINQFLVGNLSSAKLGSLWLPAAALLVGFVVLLADAHRLNAVLVGDETAASLGVNVGFLRLRLILATALLAGVMVAQTGIIGFVGLVIPHMTRLLVGSDHRRVVPVAMFLGAAYLVLCDFLAYQIATPYVLPIGLVASGVGAPVFLWLLRQGMASRKV
ncbi:MAG: FecCD family ABC transporter permease [Sporichthyaceae bacterium]